MTSHMARTNTNNESLPTTIAPQKRLRPTKPHDLSEPRTSSSSTRQRMPCASSHPVTTNLSDDSSLAAASNTRAERLRKERNSVAARPSNRSSSDPSLLMFMDDATTTPSATLQTAQSSSRSSQSSSILSSGTSSRSSDPSKRFSLALSTITTRGQTGTLPPNKLAKRSFSDHMPLIPSSPDLESTGYYFRRPFTTHQRLASWTSQGSNSPEFCGSDRIATQPTNIHSPTFPLEARPRDRRSFFFSSRPLSLLTTASSLSIPDLTQPNPPLSRRAFSIGDLFSRSSTRKYPPSIRVRRASSRRVLSEPSSNHSSAQTPHQDDYERPSKRRELSAVPTFDSAADSIRKTFTQLESESLQLSLPRSRPNAAVHPFPDASTSSLGPHTHSPSLSLSSVGLTYSRPSRPSVTVSDLNSSQFDSDYDMRNFSSGEEDNADLRSDTVYDSLRTDVTRSSTSFDASKLDTIFRQEPSTPAHSQRDSPKRRSSSTDDSHSKTPRRRKYQGLDDQEDTPGRTTRREQFGTPSLTAKNLSETSEALEKFPSPSWATQLYIKEPDWNQQADLEDFGWDTEDGDRLSGLRRGYPWNLDGPYDSASRDQSVDSTTTVKVMFDSEPTRRTATANEIDVRSRLFDWSEQQPLDKGPMDTPPRPKTVHGKKDADGRGSRSAGRRGPSGQHARSQSVPITADPAVKRSNAANKFGTWGIGSKPVTEDWDEDFDFADLGNTAGDSMVCSPDAADSGVDVFVPEAIREQQSNIVANIELLREWGLLIEELKELRSRAMSLGITTETSTGIFVEIEAMINLADQEAEDHGFPHRDSVASTPDFDADEFDAPPTPSPTKETSSSEDAFGTVSISLLNQYSMELRTKHSSSTISRPRKNSEAVARSVIQALRDRALPKDEIDGQNPTVNTKKVPFDTATLKHIVPYVNGLMHQVKQILRDAENLHTSPARRIHKSSSVPSEESAKSSRSSSSPRTPSHGQQKTESPTKGRENKEQSSSRMVDDLATHMRMMAV